MNGGALCSITTRSAVVSIGYGRRISRVAVESPVTIPNEPRRRAGSCVCQRLPIDPRNRNNAASRAGCKSLLSTPQFIGSEGALIEAQPHLPRNVHRGAPCYTLKDT